MGYVFNYDEFKPFELSIGGLYWFDSSDGVVSLVSVSTSNNIVVNNLCGQRVFIDSNCLFYGPIKELTKVWECGACGGKNCIPVTSDGRSAMYCEDCDDEEWY